MVRMRAILFAVVVLALGCASMSDVIAEKRTGGGTKQRYAVTPDVAFELSRQVLRAEGADAIEEHKAEGYMLTSSSYNGLTSGTVMGVWVAPDGPQTLVTAITKRKVAFNAVTTLTEDGFHRQLAVLVTAAAVKPAASAQSAGSGCTAAADCTGSLPQDCSTCPAGQHGGCLHWVCLSGQCLTRNCDPD
jgi:hypothetical protein